MTCQWMGHRILKWAKLVLVFSWWQPVPDPVMKPAPQQNRNVVWAENIGTLSFLNHRVVCNPLYFERPEDHCHICCNLTVAVMGLIKKSAHHYLKLCFGLCDVHLAFLRSLVVKWLIGSVHFLSRVQLFATPWTVAHQASLSITNSSSLLKLMSIELVMPSNHLILCHPLLLSSLFPSIRVFPSESVLRIRWPKYWSFSFSIGPSSEHAGLLSFRMDWLDLLAVQGTLKSLVESELSPSLTSHFPFCFWRRDIHLCL